MSEEKKQEHKIYFQGLGRRKTAVAQVRIFPKGKGHVLINQKSPREFFKFFEYEKKAFEPLKKTKQMNMVDLSIKVSGGGMHGQAEAISLGIARALLKMDESYRLELRKEGLLTRDPRKKERKKPGLKRARRAPQWRKR